jgi:hypothetical protein
MVRKVQETLAETKARLTDELERRAQNRIASLNIEAKARANRRQTGTGRKTTAPNLYSTTTTTTTTTSTKITSTTTRTTTTTTTTTINEPTFQTTSPK